MIDRRESKTFISRKGGGTHFRSKGTRFKAIGISREHLIIRREVMKKLTWILLLLIAFGAVTVANGQEYGEMKFGLGASLGKQPFPYYIYYTGAMMTINEFPAIHVPIHLNPTIFVEPFFGYWSYKYTEEWDSVEEFEKFSMMQIGIGAFYTIWYGPVDIYIGARFGYDMWKYSYKDYDSYWDEYYEGDASKNDLWFGPAIGGEYFFTQNFSLGGEVQFKYYSYGEWDYGDEEDSDYTYSEKQYYTNTLFFIRWYFGRK